VVNFAKHQNPHCKEAPSTIPAPCKHGASTSVARLIPDSGFSDSGYLIPDSLRSSSERSLRPSYSERAHPDRLKANEQNKRQLKQVTAGLIAGVPRG